MARPARVQIRRQARADGSTTFSLRVRTGGADETVALGNSASGWDEIRVETARRQLLAKIELGQWVPRPSGARRSDPDEEPTFRELATDWLRVRELNPGIANATTEKNKSQLQRYLVPFFGDLRPSEITHATIKRFREQIHVENAEIRAAAQSANPMRDPHTGRTLQTLGNDSINMALQMLAMILDDAEDAGWVDRNVARGRRVREPSERRHTRGVLDIDEFLALIEAAGQLDDHHRPETLERAQLVRVLRDQSRLPWTQIADRIGAAPTTAIYLYSCHDNPDGPSHGVRRAILATLGLAGPRVGELCNLDRQDIDLAKARFHIRDAKTDAGIRSVDIHPRLLDELTAYRATRPGEPMTAPAFPTRSGTRRDRSNVLKRVIHPVLRRANETRASRDEPPILVHLTPHTFRRTYITLMVAAGYDLPYVQAQVGHQDPSTTLSIYAQVMRRPDRDQLRAEILDLFGVQTDGLDLRSTAGPTTRLVPPVTNLRPPQKASKGLTHRL
jgi:integrase